MSLNCVHLFFDFSDRFSSDVCGVVRPVRGHLDDHVVHGHQLVRPFAHGGHQRDPHREVIFVAENWTEVWCVLFAQFFYNVFMARKLCLHPTTANLNLIKTSRLNVYSLSHCCFFSLQNRLMGYLMIFVKYIRIALTEWQIECK